MFRIGDVLKYRDPEDIFAAIYYKVMAVDTKRKRYKLRYKMHGKHLTLHATFEYIHITMKRT